MKRKLSIWTTLVAAVCFCSLTFSGIDVSEAKTASSPSRSSSSGFSNSYKSTPAKSASSGWTNSAQSKPAQQPAIKPATPVQPKPTASGFTNSAQSSKPADTKQAFGNSSGNKAVVASTQQPAVPLTPLQAKMNTAYSKEQSKKAYTDYKAEKNKFKVAEGTGSVRKPTREQESVINKARSKNYSSRDYYARRNTFYTHNNYTIPAYAYSSAPSFGAYDAMFLWFMLDHINDEQYAKMHYNHQNDEDMRAWRQEANRLAKDNAELKAKLDRLDAETTKMKEKGEAVDASYVPPDASDVVLSSKVVEEAEEEEGGSVWPWIFGFSVLGLGGYFMFRRLV